MHLLKHLTNLNIHTNLESTVFVRFLCTLLEKIGAFGLHQGTAREKRNQKIYVFVVNGIYLILTCFHFHSFVVRSTRYLPECFQVVYEGLSIVATIIIVYFFRMNYDKLDRLINLMEKTFSKADEKVTQRCLRDSRRIFVIIYFLVLCSGYGRVVEALIPLSAKDAEIQRMVYPTKNQGRRQPLRMLIPYIDETESYAYEIIFALQLYFIFLVVSQFALVMSLIPVILLYLQGQYEILGKYVEKIGVVQTDTEGNVIFYTDIESDSYAYESFDVVDMNTMDEKSNETNDKIPKIQVDHAPKTIQSEEEKKHSALKRKSDYEQNYVKQIVKFHQKLIIFQDKLLDLINPIALCVILFNTLALSLCIYEVMVFDPTVRLYIQLISVVVEYFFLCNMSEMADDFNGSMRRALVTSAWHKCSNTTRRDLCMLLRLVQRPNHLTFHSGAVVISNAFFMGVVKTSYSFVNFMRLRLNVRRGTSVQ